MTWIRKEAAGGSGWARTAEAPSSGGGGAELSRTLARVAAESREPTGNSRRAPAALVVWLGDVPGRVSHTCLFGPPGDSGSL